LELRGNFRCLHIVEGFTRSLPLPVPYLPSRKFVICDGQNSLGAYSASSASLW
jgi:hypothetical protein